MYAARRLLLSCLSFFLLFSGCGALRQSDPLPVCKGRFQAVLQGTRGEISFCTEAVVNGDLRQVIYTEPEALRGLTVTGQSGGARVERNGIGLELPPDSVRELLLPLTLLTAPGKLSARQKQGDQTLFILEDGSELTVSEDGVPRFAKCGELSFRVTDFSSLPE